MSGRRSKRKGAGGEREWAKYLTDRGFPAHRGRQYSGGPTSPDVICESLPVNFEVKRVERFRLYPSLMQSAGDCAEGEIPAVAHRKNMEPWVVVLWAEDFMEMARELYGDKS